MVNDEVSYIEIERVRELVNRAASHYAKFPVGASDGYKWRASQLTMSEFSFFNN